MLCRCRPVWLRPMRICGRSIHSRRRRRRGRGRLLSTGNAASSPPAEPEAASRPTVPAPGRARRSICVQTASCSQSMSRAAACSHSEPAWQVHSVVTRRSPLPASRRRRRGSSWVSSLRPTRPASSSSSGPVSTAAPIWACTLTQRAAASICGRRNSHIQALRRTWDQSWEKGNSADTGRPGLACAAALANAMRRRRPAGHCCSGLSSVR